MLKYAGHEFKDAAICSCCVGDKRVIAIDPTGTSSIRTAFNSTLAIKWRGLRALVRSAIVDQDLLSLGSKGLMAIANPAVQGSATKIQMFQRWFDYVLTQQVLGVDGSFIRSFVGRGYNAGVQFAQREVGDQFLSRRAGDRQDALVALAFVELQGITEAVSQQAVRAVAAGLLHNSRPAAIVRTIQGRIDSVGINRSAALVELIIVKAFGEATLDVYEVAGVSRVGLLPELMLDAKRAVRPRGRAGTRSRKSPVTPSPSTIERIAREESTIARRAGNLVEVRTAGDKKVCPICKRISRNGPYRIDRARALIPAHPRCRCVFVPADTHDAGPEDEPRDYHGRWTAGGAVIEHPYSSQMDRWNKQVDSQLDSEEDGPKRRALGFMSNVLQFKETTRASQAVNHRYSFIEKDDQLIAAGHFQFDPSTKVATITHLGSTVKGGGSQALEHLIKQASAKSAKSIELLATSYADESNVGFYEKHGFKIVGGSKADEAADDVHMRLNLKGRRTRDAFDGNPYHKGKGPHGGQFTTGPKSGEDDPSTKAEIDKKKQAIKEKLTKSIDFERSHEYSIDELSTELAHKNIDADEFMNSMFPVKLSGPLKGFSSSDRKFKFVSTFKDDNRLGKMDRFLDFHNGIAYHSYLTIPNSGNGLGKKILASQVDLYKKLGFEAVDLNANIEVGGYAWAKYGFKPTENEWHHMTNYFNEKLSEIKMNPAEYHALSRLANSENPKALWAIADSKHGKRLLLGTDWDGRLDLHDKESMDRFNAYVGRKSPNV